MDMFSRQVNCVLIDGKDVGFDLFPDSDNEGCDIVRLNTLETISVERSRIEKAKGILWPFNFYDSAEREMLEGKGLYLMPPYKSIGGLDYSRTSVKIEIDHFFHDEEDGWLAAIHVASDWYCANALQLANTFLFLNGSLCAKVEALSC